MSHKFNVIDSKILDNLENDIIPGRIIALKKKGMIIDSVFRIQEIHFYLFGSIFDWAGKLRTITIYKSEPILEGASIDYTPGNYIQQEMNDLEKEFKLIKWNEISQSEKIEKNWSDHSKTLANTLFQRREHQNCCNVLILLNENCWNICKYKLY